MPSITVEVEFHGRSYTASITETDVSLTEDFDGAATAILAYYMYEGPPQGFLAEAAVAPRKLSEFAAWRVLEVGDMPSIRIGKGTKQRLQDIETVFEACGELGADEFEVYTLWCDESNHGFSADEYKERYCGAFDNEGAYAVELLNDCLDLRKTEYDMVRNYIDYEGMERDMVLNGDIGVIEQGCTRHIFRTY